MLFVLVYIFKGVMFERYIIRMTYEHARGGSLPVGDFAGQVLLPAGTIASFSPATVTAGQSSTLTVSPSLSAAAATTTLTVTGTGTTTSHTASTALTVTAPAAVRAAFYYPWFPQTWGSDPLNRPAQEEYAR